MTVSWRTSLAKRMVGAAIVTGGIVFGAVLPNTAQAVSLATTSGAVAPHGLVQKARVTINVNTRALIGIAIIGIAGTITAGGTAGVASAAGGEP